MVKLRHLQKECLLFSYVFLVNVRKLLERLIIEHTLNTDTFYYLVILLLESCWRIWHSTRFSTSKFSKSQSSDDYSLCCVVNFQTMTCTEAVMTILCLLWTSKPWFVLVTFFAAFNFQLTVFCCFPGINEDCLHWQDTVWEVLGFNSEHKSMINCKFPYI